MAFCVVANICASNAAPADRFDDNNAVQRHHLLRLLHSMADENGYVNVKRSNAELVNGLLSMPAYEDLARAGKK